MPPSPRLPFDQMPAPQQAGILCNDPRFQRFAAMRCGLPGQQFGETAAAAFLRSCCRITSRSALATDPAAAQAFEALKTSFDGWTGKQAMPRGRGR